MAQSPNTNVSSGWTRRSCVQSANSGADAASHLLAPYSRGLAHAPQIREALTIVNEIRMKAGTDAGAECRLPHTGAVALACRLVAECKP